MLQCGLVRTGRKHQPVAAVKNSQKGGSYTWDEFISEYKLDIEVSHAYVDGRLAYFVRVGQFSAAPFTIVEQIRNHKTFEYTGIHHRQIKFIKSLAQITLSLLPTPSAASEPAPSETDLGTSSAAFCSHINNQCADADEFSSTDIGAGENFKSLLQLHLFDRIFIAWCLEFKR